jgi:pimeloyl-ACP methyl ester carboxylesterase
MGVASAPASKRMVLVHGLGGAPRWWRAVLPALQAYDVVHGDPRRALEVGDDAILVGHSFGGMRAAQFAAQHPVRKLVLVAPAGIPTGRSFLVETLCLLNQAPPRAVPMIVTDALRWGPRALLRYGREATHARIDAATITAPTLLVWGERDNVVPLRFAEEWQAAIPGSTLKVIPRVRHVPMMESPSAFVEVLLDFLRDDARSGVVDGMGLARDRDEPPAL